MNDQHSRGGEWVIGQMVLILAILVAPRRLLGISIWPKRATQAARILGVASVGTGIGLAAAGGRTLGDNLTPFPRPKDDGTLVQTGVYGLVRHPLYTALILLALGWSLLRGSTPSLILTAILAIFFDRKAAVEEGWLAERFPEYSAYQQRVAKLLPWVY